MLRVVRWEFGESAIVGRRVPRVWMVTASCGAKSSQVKASEVKSIQFNSNHFTALLKTTSNEERGGVREVSGLRLDHATVGSMSHAFVDVDPEVRVKQVFQAVD
ncbi:hypothetical protein TcWFU_004313 [Taenia crassiceps]|uniref:Uncharacterized protein n=1 Tax=Taenia crassiceps TaxID=6207 RepID=A0ABR4PZJ8_9CEST